MLSIWHTISQKYVLSGETRALSQSSHEPPEIQALTEEYSGESSNSCTNDSCTNDSVSLGMSRTLSSDPEAEVSARPDGGRRLADFIKNMESFADGRPPFAEGGQQGGLEFSSSSESSQVLYLQGNPDGNPGLEAVINKQLKREWQYQ